MSTEDHPIRSVQEFIRRYFPSAKPCPHCNGTGMKRESSKYAVPNARL